MNLILGGAREGEINLSNYVMVRNFGDEPQLLSDSPGNLCVSTKFLHQEIR